MAGDGALYLKNRTERLDFSYRLLRRTSEIKAVILRCFRDYSTLNCLDIGAADGIMLSSLNNEFGFGRAIGIDISTELFKENGAIELEQGNAESLNFGENVFDIVIASAVIEHVDNPNKLLSECYRVLKKGGILVITTPNPFHDKIAVKIGYYSEKIHKEMFTLKKLNDYLIANSFKVIDSSYFMIFPFFRLPGEKLVESFLRLIHLGMLMSNQLAVGRKL